MRKVFWCCVAAGAVVCCAFWAAAYVSQNPDSALGRCALAFCPAGPHAAAGAPGQTGASAVDDLVPDDPVPVDDPPPVPAPGAPVPPEMAAVGTPPPIVIHDEEDLNVAVNPTPAEPSFTKHVDSEGEQPSADAGRTDNGVEVRPTAPPPVMPRCADDDSAAPRMPYCTDDSTPAADPSDVRKVSGAPYREFDACAFWVGFFSGPSHMFAAAEGGRCEEDSNYPRQYSGVPYTGEEATQPVQQATAHEKPLPSLSTLEGPSELPAPKEKKQEADPSELFDHPHHLKTSQPSEPQSDTMEMRPTDWKPYSLDPGPF